MMTRGGRTMIDETAHGPSIAALCNDVYSALPRRPPEAVDLMVDRRLDMDLQIAKAPQHPAPQFRQLRPATLFSADGRQHQRRVPSLVHRVEHHPRPPVTEA